MSGNAAELTVPLATNYLKDQNTKAVDIRLHRECSLSRTFRGNVATASKHEKMSAVDHEHIRIRWLHNSMVVLQCTDDSLAVSFQSVGAKDFCQAKV